MTNKDEQVARRPDGSIDIGHYADLAHRTQAEAVRRAVQCLFASFLTARVHGRPVREATTRQH